MNRSSQTDGTPRQEIVLRDRAYLRLGGVEEVCSFDDCGIILRSCFGMISVDGEELHILNLSTGDGQLEIEGKIGGVLFFDETSKRAGRRKRGGSARGEL